MLGKSDDAEQGVKDIISLMLRSGYSQEKIDILVYKYSCEGYFPRKQRQKKVILNG